MYLIQFAPETNRVQDSYLTKKIKYRRYKSPSYKTATQQTKHRVVRDYHGRRVNQNGQRDRRKAVIEECRDVEVTNATGTG